MVTTIYDSSRAAGSPRRTDPLRLGSRALGANGSVSLKRARARPKAETVSLKPCSSLQPDGLRRRRRDSNPRYPYEYAGFQNRCLKPLGHSSKSRIPGAAWIALEFSVVTWRVGLSKQRRGTRGCGSSDTRVADGQPREDSQIQGNGRDSGLARGLLKGVTNRRGCRWRFSANERFGKYTMGCDERARRGDVRDWVLVRGRGLQQHAR